MADRAQELLSRATVSPVVHAVYRADQLVEACTTDEMRRAAERSRRGSKSSKLLEGHSDPGQDRRRKVVTLVSSGGLPARLL
jgi:hypothetical protein